MRTIIRLWKIRENFKPPLDSIKSNPILHGIGVGIRVGLLGYPQRFFQNCYKSSRYLFGLLAFLNVVEGATAS
jgi:hypothetical protein